LPRAASVRPLLEDSKTPLLPPGPPRETSHERGSTTPSASPPPAKAFGCSSRARAPRLEPCADRARRVLGLRSLLDLRAGVLLRALGRTIELLRRVRIVDDERIDGRLRDGRSDLDGGARHLLPRRSRR